MPAPYAPNGFTALVGNLRTSPPTRPQAEAGARQTAGGAAQQDILPVVRYANRRRIDGGAPDYWDHATRMELAVIARDRADAFKAAAAALAVVRETWEPRTTANNLALIREARAEHDEIVAWADELESELLKAAGANG